MKLSSTDWLRLVSCVLFLLSVAVGIYGEHRWPVGVTGGLLMLCSIVVGIKVEEIERALHKNQQP